MDSDWSKEATECDDFVLSIYEDYSVDTVAELLLPSGLLVDKSTQYVGPFEEFVFFHGNKYEVYTKCEIDFISGTEDITVFKEFYKKTPHTLIPCRVVTVKNSEFNPLDDCIAFTKIINKASDAFNICVVVSAGGIVFTCRSYDSLKTNDYIISNILTSKEQIEELFDELMYSSDYNALFDFYSYIRDCIQFERDSVEDSFDDSQKDSCDFSFFEDRWKSGKKALKPYANRVAEAEEDLFMIEPTRTNTLEMLFMAEDAEMKDSTNELNDEEMSYQRSTAELSPAVDIDMRMKSLLDDPELMINHLKKEREL